MQCLRQVTWLTSFNQEMISQCQHHGRCCHTADGFLSAMRIRWLVVRQQIAASTVKHGVLTAAFVDRHVVLVERCARPKTVTINMSINFVNITASTASFGRMTRNLTRSALALSAGTLRAHTHSRCIKHKSDVLQRVASVQTPGRIASSVSGSALPTFARVSQGCRQSVANWDGVVHATNGNQASLLRCLPR